MKTILKAAALAVVALLTLNLSLLAEGKDLTISGEGKCGKCALKETKSCQNVIQVTKDGKTESYYLVQNDVSKKFHEHLCSATAKVKATGTCKKVDGKLEFTASKIELVK